MTNDENTSIVMFDEDTIIAGFIEITLPEERTFLRITETLTRIGIVVRGGMADERPSILQVCHILHKRGRYYIVHHRELAMLAGSPEPLRRLDIHRRNRIAVLLQAWGLCSLVDRARLADADMAKDGVRVIRFADVHRYELVPQHLIGAARRQPTARDDMAIHGS
jgi:hypothetical protein